MIESYKNTIFTKGYVTIASMYLPNQKGRGNSEGRFFGPHRISSGQNKKYTDGPNQLSYVESGGSHYLSFQYRQYNRESRTNVQEEVLVSYPHLSSLENFLNDVIQKNSELDIFDSNGVALKYENYIIQSEGFAQNKRLALAPTVQNEYGPNNTQVPKQGFFLMINDPEKKIFLSIDSLIQLINQIKPFTRAATFRMESRMNEIEAIAIETNKIVKQIAQSVGANSEMETYQQRSQGNYSQGNQFQQQNNFQQQPRQNGNMNYSGGQFRGNQQQNNFQQQANPFSSQSQQSSIEENPFARSSNNQQSQPSRQNNEPNPFATEYNNESSNVGSQNPDRAISDDPFASNNSETQKPSEEPKNETSYTNTTGTTSDLASTIFKNAAEVDSSNIDDEDINI